MAGPLDGVKIVDLSQVIAGPLATAWLADQGANVIKVEDARGDPARTIGTRKENMSALFCAVNRGKRSVVLDLKSEVGKAGLEHLLSDADVFVQNFRPGVVERLGFGFDRLTAKLPRLIYCSMSGFGDSGPRAKARTYDSVVQASAGFAAQQAKSGGDPELVRNYLCDKTTALIASQAITAALFSREKSGRGQRIDLNMFDAGIAFMWPEGMQNHTFVDAPPDPTPEVGDFYRLWATKDGHIAFASPKQEEFVAMTRALGRPDLASDPRFASMDNRNRNREAYWAILAEAIGLMSTDELDKRMREEDAAGARVNRRADLLSDAQAASNGTIIEIDGGRIGRLRAARHPARFSDTPVDAPRRAPELGEGNDALLRAGAPLASTGAGT